MGLTNKQLNNLFKLPPDKAIGYLESLGVVITSNWLDLLENARGRAFTIAGVMKEDILKDAKAIITSGVAEGKTFNSIKDEFRSRVQAKGWDASTYRLKTIYRVNTDLAYQYGRYTEQESMKSFAPYWQYVAVMDANTRPEHAALNGKVFRADDPIWDTIYPPNGFNCRCYVRSYTEARLKRKGLKVESSAGKLKDITVEIGGKKIKTKSYDGVVIDPGWDFNIGKNFEKVKK